MSTSAVDTGLTANTALGSVCGGLRVPTRSVLLPMFRWRYAGTPTLLYTSAPRSPALGSPVGGGRGNVSTVKEFDCFKPP